MTGECRHVSGYGSPVINYRELTVEDPLALVAFIERLSHGSNVTPRHRLVLSPSEAHLNMQLSWIVYKTYKILELDYWKHLNESLTSLLPLSMKS